MLPTARRSSPSPDHPPPRRQCHSRRQCQVVLKNDAFLLKNDDFLLKNDDFLLKNDDFLLKNDDFQGEAAWSVWFDMAQRKSAIALPAASTVEWQRFGDAGCGPVSVSFQHLRLRLFFFLRLSQGRFLFTNMHGCMQVR